MYLSKKPEKVKGGSNEFLESLNTVTNQAKEMVSKSFRVRTNTKKVGRKKDSVKRILLRKLSCTHVVI